ncbi:MAG: transglutaminase-like domain-containing protein [Opitutaceae bacterium]
MHDCLLHPATVSALVFVLILAANLVVFLRREWESNHRAADYSRINIPLDVPTLRDWRIQSDRLYPRICWNRHPSQWQVLHRGGVIDTVPGDAPFITLDAPRFNGQPGALPTDFRQEFTLRPLPSGIGPDITLHLTPIAQEFYRDRGLHFPHDLIQVRSTIPAGKFTRHAVADWTDDYDYIGQSALAEADRVVREEIGVQDDDPELVRMEKIVHFMRNRLVEAGGVPKDAFRWMDPFAIFKEMCAGTGKGWCTQNAQIFAFFATRAGVPTRFVYCGTVQKNRFVYDGHSWTESFLQEQNRWIYTDPQRAIVGVLDRNGLALNTADVFQLCQYGAFEGVTARIFKQWHWHDLPIEAPPDTAIDVPFSLVNDTARRQFTPHTIIKYRRPPNVEDIRSRYGMLFRSWTFTWTNLRRYLWYPDLAYSNRPTRGNTVYRLRQSLFGLLVVSGVVLILSLR